MDDREHETNPPFLHVTLISRAQPVISAGRRSSWQCCCGLLRVPTRINHPQERAELLGECWSQREAPRPLLLLLSLLLSSSEGEESQKRSGHDAEKSSCQEVAERMLRGLLVPSRSPRSRADQCASFGVLLLLPAS